MRNDVSDFIFDFVGAMPLGVVEGDERPRANTVRPYGYTDRKRGRFLDLFLLLKANYLEASSIATATATCHQE
jgi:hypothetical protein